MHRLTRFGFAFVATVLVIGVTAARADLIEVYDVPEGAHPHDVAPSSIGKVWYTAQHQGALGVIDPAMREVEQFPLGEGSAPHGVIEGPDRAAWITDGGLNAIVRFDPTTEEIQTWPLPPERANANLNTAAFDGDGILWFTGQNGIYGSLDPESGDMQVFDAPRGPGPYGITATPDGEIYFASLAGNYIAHIDRSTGAAEVIEPPTPNQGARRVWSDSNGNIWVSEWNSGQLSRYSPDSGEWDAWMLPGEAPQPYAVYVDPRDVVWVSDFGSNEIHAFNAESEEFVARYPTSGEGAQVRQINGRLNEIWLPESGRDRLMQIRVSSMGLY